MEPPLFPAGGPQIVRAAPGSAADLLLPVPFGSPPFQYDWSRAGATLDERFIVSDDAGGVRLTVSAARTGDSGVYTLQASNAAGKDTTRVRLEVSPDEAPVGDDPPNFLRRLQDLTVKVGTRTRFLVEIVSSTECKVTWYRNERRLMETERVALVRDGNFWCADVATVSVDDAGRWTCTAENVGGRASCSAHLNVLVPKAYKRPEFVEELRALLTEQGTVSLECKVVGVPTPVLRWFKDSREIKAGDVFALTANAEDPTSLGTYTCEAVNCMGRAYSSSKVHVVGRGSREGSARPSSGGLTPDPPPIFTKELEDQFVRICDPLTLSCHIVVPPWPRSVVWYNKEGKIEPSERYHVLEDGVGGYLLEVASAEWADEGEWKCVASTAGGRVGMSACYVSMDVPKNYRKPRFMENLQAVLTEEGLVSFECKVVGFPTPVLSWFKDGQELKPGDVYQLTGTNSLGSYCCIARNCMGQASSSAELTVEDIQNQLNEEEKHQLFSKNQAPKFLQGLKSVEAKIDEPFRFTIKVAIPPEPTLLWYRDDQPVDESSRCHHGKEERGVFYLDIQNLEFLDQAEWKCVAMNDFGQSVTSCFLKLIIPRHYKKPRFLENLQAILSDEGAVNLECKVIGVPQPVLKWYKDGEELKPGDIHRIISGQDGTCCLGTYTCEAQNCMGIAASSASLLGFDDSLKAKSKKKSEEQTLQRNLSLSTIHEERTSQMYDTPLGDRTLDDKGEISFSFDGKEVSVSLYETPDLTEEEALQIVEMYADQLSENVTEHNVVELPPLRFVKETSTSGNLLMEAIIIDVSPEYFTSPEEDLRTEADIEDISIADENGAPQISLDQDFEISGPDYLEKTMALLSDEKADIPKKLGRKKSDSQRSADDYFSLSRDQSLSDDKRDDDTQMISESDLQSFASARSSGKRKASKPSLEEPIHQAPQTLEIAKSTVSKDDVIMSTEPEVSAPKAKRERRRSRSSRRSSSGSDKSMVKMKEDVGQVENFEQPPKKLIADEEYKSKINNISVYLSKLVNDIQIIERDIILQSELMSSAATASKSLEIIGSLITPLSEMQSIVEVAKESAAVSPEINSALFNNLPQPFKALYQTLTLIEKCIDVESDSKTLVKKTCVSLIEKCGNDIQKAVSEINSLVSKKYLDVEEKVISDIDATSNEMITIIRFSTDTIKTRSLLHEASEFKADEPSVEMQHSKDTQKAIFELKGPLQSLLRIIESTERDHLIDGSNVKNSEIILDDMSTSIQHLQAALEQIESLSVKESTTPLMTYNTEIIETVMDPVLKLRTSFEQLSTEAKKEENENVLKQVLSTVKLNLNELSSHIDIFEQKVGKFDILQSENKLEVLQKMAQTLISFENSLPVLDVVQDVKNNMVKLHKNLTKVLENVIESNDASKYFAFMEICDSINRVNSSVKNIEFHDIFTLTSISNTLRIVQDQFIQNIFEPELNCAILSNIEDIQINLLDNINIAEEISFKTDSDRIQDLQFNKKEESKACTVLESINHSITAITKVVTEEHANDLKSTLTPVFESIQPNLVELKQKVASMIAVDIEREDHASEISDVSLSNTLAQPLFELNQNVEVLNQTLIENVKSLKENSTIASTYAQPLHELQKTIETLQHEVISQCGEDILPCEIASNIANVVQNLQNCIVLIQEQSGIETADEMSTLDDISGIKTTTEVMSTDHLVLPTTEEVLPEQLAETLKVEQPELVTAETLQALHEHVEMMQAPDIIEFLESLSEISDYNSLKSVAVSLGELNEGVQEIFHPMLMENSKELLDSLNTSKLIEIAEPIQDLHKNLSVVNISDIPIYESFLKIPSDKIHSAIEKISEFKDHLESCLNVMIPAIETVEEMKDVSSNIDLVKKMCVDLNIIFQDSEGITTCISPEVSSFRQKINNFLEATSLQDIDVREVKSLTENLYAELLLVQDELIKCTPQPSETISHEIKLIESVQELENKIAVLEQFHFVDLSHASDIDSCVSPQLAVEIETNSLNNIDDLVNHAVNIVHDAGENTPTADLMILEDFFKTCKLEFSILRCLIKKRPTHKKIIRLLQEFSFLRSIINDFKEKRSELYVPEDIKDLLSNFMLNLDTSMNDIEKSLIKIVNSQSKILIDTPMEILKNSAQVIECVKKNNIIPADLAQEFGKLVEHICPSFDTIQTAIVKELQESDMSSILAVEKSIVIENVDNFFSKVEEQIKKIDNEDQKRVMEKLLSCSQKHQDYKDVTGQSKLLLIIKCLAECSNIFNEQLMDGTEQTILNKDLVISPEEVSLQSILLEMVEPLQGLRDQLVSIQEQISSGVEEECLSIDLSSTESYVQVLTDIHKNVVQLIENEKPVLDESELSLIESLDNEFQTIQESIQSVKGPADVVKQIILPLGEIEKSLHSVKEKGVVETQIAISKENAEVLMQHINQYIEFVEIIEEESAILKIDDLLETANIARELRESIDNATSNMVETDTELNISPEQDSLMNKLQRALSSLQEQALDSVLEMVPSFDDYKRRHIIEVVANLQADLLAITCVQVAVVAPSDSTTEQLQMVKAKPSGSVEKEENQGKQEKMVRDEVTGEVSKEEKIVFLSEEPPKTETLDLKTLTGSESETQAYLEKPEELRTIEATKHDASILDSENLELANITETSVIKSNENDNVPEFGHGEDISAGLSPITLSIGTLVQHIKEYLSEEVIETIANLATISDNIEVEQSLNVAKELHDNITALEVLPLESVSLLQDEEHARHKEMLLHLQDELHVLNEITLYNAEELKATIGENALGHFAEVVQNLQADIVAIASPPLIMNRSEQSDVKCEEVIQMEVSEQSPPQEAQVLTVDGHEKVIEDEVKTQTHRRGEDINAELSPTTLTIGTLVQHIKEYLSEEVIETIANLATISDNIEVEQSLNVAKELHDNITALEVLPMESVSLLQDEEYAGHKEILLHLHEELHVLNELTLNNAEELKATIGENALGHFAEVVQNLQADIVAIASPPLIMNKSEQSDVKCEEVIQMEVSEQSLPQEAQVLTVDGHEKVIEDEVKTQTHKRGEDISAELSPITLTIGTLVQHIKEYLSEEVIETIANLATISDNIEVEQSLNVAKELHDNITALEVLPMESVSLLQDEENAGHKEILLHLQEELHVLNELTLNNAEELKATIGENALGHFAEVVQNLQADIVAIASPPLIMNRSEQSDVKCEEVIQMEVSEQTPPQEAQVHTVDVHEKVIEDEVKTQALSLITAPTESTIEEIVEINDQRADAEDIDSIKKLETLLSEVTSQVNLSSTDTTVEDTELLRNVLDEVQTVIIKLKCDLDETVNDTLNETLEDLECSVRSVQLQIDENSSPELLKDACATLQLLVNNMIDIKDQVTHPSKEKNSKAMLQECCDSSEQTIKLLDDASQVDSDGQLINVVSKLKVLRDTLKLLSNNFRGDASSLINNGVDVVQSLDQMEEQIFALEKDIEAVTSTPDIKDSIIVAVHTVYENISNMRSTLSSIQKEYMYENYAKPSENFLRSMKNISFLFEHDKKSNWKHLRKVLRQVLNHFEDIKFYVNFDKTARIPSDAAFTKIILDELSKEINEVFLTNVLESYPEMKNKVLEVLSKVKESNISLQSRTTIEVKEKIPIFKIISEEIVQLTNAIRGYVEDQNEIEKNKENKISERMPLDEEKRADNSEAFLLGEEKEQATDKGNEEVTSLLSQRSYEESKEKTEMPDSEVSVIDSKEKVIKLDVKESDIPKTDTREPEVPQSPEDSKVMDAGKSDIFKQEQGEVNKEHEETATIGESEIDVNNDKQTSETKDEVLQEGQGKTQDENTLQMQIKSVESDSQTKEYKEPHDETVYLDDVHEEALKSQHSEDKVEIKSETEEIQNSEVETQDLQYLDEKQHQADYVKQVESEKEQTPQKDNESLVQDKEILQHAEDEKGIHQLEETQEDQKVLQHEKETEISEKQELLEELQMDAENNVSQETISTEISPKCTEEEKMKSENEEQNDNKKQLDAKREKELQASERKQMLEEGKDSKDVEMQVKLLMENDEQKSIEIEEKQKDIEVRKDEERESLEAEKTTLKKEKDSADAKAEDKEENLEMEKATQEIKIKNDDETSQSQKEKQVVEMETSVGDTKSHDDKEELDTRVKEIEKKSEKGKQDVNRESEDYDVENKIIDEESTKQKQIMTTDVEAIGEEKPQQAAQEETLEKDTKDLKVKQEKHQELADAEKKLDEDAKSLREKETVELKCKEDEEKLSLEKGKEEEPDAKQREIDEKMQSKKEGQEEEKKQPIEETTKLQREDGKADDNQIPEAEKLCLEKENQETEKTCLDQEARLQIKMEESEDQQRTEVEKLRAGKEKPEVTEERVEEEVMIQKEENEADIKQKEAEAKQDMKKKQLDDIAEIQKKSDADAKQKAKEEKISQEKEQPERKEKDETDSKWEGEQENKEQEMKKKTNEQQSVPQKETEDEKAKEKTEAEKLLKENEMQEAEKRRLIEEARLQDEKDEAIAEKNEEKLKKEKKETERDRLKEEEPLQKEKHDTEAKQESESLKLQVDKEKQEAEKKRLNEEACTQIEEDETDVKKEKEEEKLRIEKKKEESEKKRLDEEARFQKEKDEADAKMKAEEELEKEKQESEKKRLKEEATLQKEKTDAEAKEKTEAEKLQLEKEKQEGEKKRLDEEASVQKEKDEADAKKKIEEEKLRIENEKQEAEKKRLKEDARLQKEKDDAESQKKVDEEKLQKEKEKEEAEKKRLEKDARLQKEKDEADAKRSAEEEKLRIEKGEEDTKKKPDAKDEADTEKKAEEGKLGREKQETEKKSLEEEAILQEEKIDAEAKEKAEAEKIQLAKEKQEAEKKCLDEEASIQKEKDEADAKKKAEEGKLGEEKQEKEKKRLEEEAILQKEKTDAESKEKAEAEKLQLEKDKQEAEKKRLDEEASMQKEKDEADGKMKAEEEKLRKEKEKEEAEKKRLNEEARLQKEKDEADAKKKAEEEELVMEKEKEEEEKRRLDEEARLQKEKDKADTKKKAEEEKLRIEKEKQEVEKKRLDEEARLQKEKDETDAIEKAEEEKLRMEKEEQEAEKKRLDEEARLQKEKDEADAKKKAEEEQLRMEKEKEETEKKRLDEEAKLQKEKDEADAKKKEEEEEKIRIEKEKQEAEKKRLDEDAKSQKEKDEADAKKKAEEEKLLKRKEKKEAEKKRLDEEAKLQKEKDEADAKKKAEEEKLRMEKEKEETEKKRLDEEAKLQKEKDEADAKKKEEEEKIRIEKEKQEAEKKRLDEEAKSQKEKDEADAKKKAEEEKLQKRKEKKEAEKKRLDEEARLQKEKDETDAKKKAEEEKIRIEKEKQEAEKKRLDEEAKLQKEKDEADAKKKEEEEKLRIEKEKQEVEKKRLDEEARLQKEKDETDAIEKAEEEKLRMEKEEQEAEKKRLDEEARLQKEKDETDAKKKAEEEKIRIEKEKQEAEKKRLDEEAKLQKEKDEADAKKKEEEEKIRIEKEKQEAEKKRLDEEAKLQKEKDEADAKKKADEEKLRIEKEKEEAEKKRLDEEAKSQKEKAEADAKKKVEEEKLQKEKEKKEAEKKRLDEEARLQKEKDEADAKKAKEEKLKKEMLETEKKRLEEEERSQKEKADAEAKEKAEVEKLQIEKEKQEAEKKRLDEKARLQKEKDEADAKKKAEEEKVRKEKEKEEEEKKRLDEKARLQKEKDDDDAKKKAEEEKIRIQKEKEELEKKRPAEEAKLQKEKEADASLKDKGEKKRRSSKKKQDKEKKHAEEQTSLPKETEALAELKSNENEARLTGKEIKTDDHDLNNKIDIELEDKTETSKKRLDKEVVKSNRKDDANTDVKKLKKEGTRKKSVQKVVEDYVELEGTQKKAQKDEDIKCIKQESLCIEDEKSYRAEGSTNISTKVNGSIEKYKLGEIDISSLTDVRHDQKDKSQFINYNNNDIGLEMYKPPGYIEKKYDENNKYISMDIDSSNKIPATYKAQTLVYQAQLRSTTPQQFEMGRSSESVERRTDMRQRSKALTETKSTIEKRVGTSRDHKRKPVFSTYLTDRTAVEASRVKLTCSVLSSIDPTITWYKNGVLLDNKLKYRTKFVDGLITLEVLNAVPSDSAEYTCTVQNENGSVSTSANLKVYPSFEASPIPPTFTRSIRDTYHLAENELVLECRIRGQPLPTITWLKDDRLISSDERIQAYYLADGVCRLAIGSPTAADSGKYTCKAENSMWSDQITHVVNFTGRESRLGPNLATIEKSRFNRQAMESRRPHFTNVLSDYKVTRGGTIGLQVEIKGSPTRVEWLREGRSVTEIYRNAQTFVEQGLYTLALADVTEKESGMYTCRAWSSHGNVDMNAAITVVQPNELEGKPAIIVGRPQKDVLISVGEDLNISFRVQGEPKPKVIFMKGMRDITNSQRVCKMTSDDYVKFTLKRSVVSDAGTYCILARNAYGCDRAFVTVVIRQRASSENLISDWTYPQDDTAVSVAERNYKSVPDRIPGEPSVVDGGNNWISLAWSKPDQQKCAPVLAYKVESWLLGKEGGARWIELGITPLNSFDAFNLKQGEEYHFRVTPRNRYGWGEAVQTSNPIVIGLSGERPEFTEILPGQLKVLVGETANLSCSFKGKPIPEIVWMKNGHEIEDVDDRIKTLLNGFDCCLTIKDVQIEDEARYSCEASNVHGRASTYARMAVITDRLVWEADAKLKRERSAGVEGEYPPQFTMRLRDRRVQATYPVRLTCQVIGSPAPAVTWFKDGHELAYDSRHNKSQDEHFHTLEIAPTSLEDGGVYEAMARNSSGAVSCRCSLVVDKGIRAYVAPEFCCGLEPLYRLYEGEELRISAMVEAYPSVGVTWYRDGVRLRPSRRAIMTLDHDGQIELALASITRRDAGVYTCTASNEVGRASTSGKVEVIGGDQAEDKPATPPVVISPDVPYSKEPMFIRKPRSSEAYEGDTVIIECEVIGDPKPDVYWLRDFLKPDYYRDANHFKRVGAGPEYRFEIPHAKLDYTGTYSVVARNEHGEAKAIISLQILAKDITATDDAHNIRYGRVDVIPRFDKELTDLLCYDGDAIEFECRVSGNPEPYIKWLHYNDVIRDCPDFETSFEEGTARLKIKQVTAEDEGTYTCEASNHLGKAKSSACLVVYPPGEPNTLSQRLRRPPALLSAASTPRSTPRATPARSLSRTPGPDSRRLCSPSREVAPKFYTYPFNKVVEEGERVVFKCAVRGLPNPWATWDKDGIVITPTSRITIREKDEMLRILEIEEVTIEDVGLYRITLENDYGRAEASARLEVISHKGKFYGGIRSCSASPRRTLYRRRTPSTSRQD